MNPIQTGFYLSISVLAVLAANACDRPADKPSPAPAPAPTSGATAIPGPEVEVPWTFPGDWQWRPEELELVAVNNTLDRFHDAAAKADFDAYFAVWTDDSVFLGTDASERWVGDQFKNFARPIFAKGKGWTYHPHDRHVSTAAKGTVAYFDELLDNDKLGLCRGSGVLEKRGDDWKILQYNLSIPVPNDIALDLTKRIREFKPAPPPAPPAPK